MIKVVVEGVSTDKAYNDAFNLIKNALKCDGWHVQSNGEDVFKVAHSHGVILRKRDIDKIGEQELVAPVVNADADLDAVIGFAIINKPDVIFNGGKQIDLSECNFQPMTRRDMDVCGWNPLFFILTDKSAENEQIVHQFRNRVRSRGGFCV